MSEELITQFDIRGREEDGLTIECAWNVGKALADWLPVDGAIAVLYQPEGEATATAIVEGARLQGRSVMSSKGDVRKAADHIIKNNLAGAAVISKDAATNVTVIELYNNDGALITSETGLRQMCELVEAGNFVPSAAKGSLTQL